MIEIPQKLRFQKKTNTLFLILWGAVLAGTWLFFLYYPKYEVQKQLISSNINRKSIPPSHFRPENVLRTKGFQWGKIENDKNSLSTTYRLELVTFKHTTARFTWYIDIPPDNKFLQVSAFLKNHEVMTNPLKSQGGRLDLQFLNDNGEVRRDVKSQVVKLSQNRDWQQYKKVFQIPEGSRNARLVVSQSGKGSKLWAENVSVSGAVQTPDYILWHKIVSLLFVCTVTITFILCMFWSQNSWLLLLVTLVIGVGSILPNYFLVNGVQQVLLRSKVFYAQQVERSFGSLIKHAKTVQNAEATKQVTTPTVSRGVAITVIKKTGHFGLYVLLGILLALRLRLRKNEHDDQITIRCGIALLLFATTTEVGQYFTMSRTPHFHDLLLNYSGLATGYLPTLLLLPANSTQLQA